MGILNYAIYEDPHYKELTHAGQLILHYMAHRANKDGFTDVGQTRICNDLNIDIRTLRLQRGELIQHGFIMTKQVKKDKGTGYRYIVKNLFKRQKEGTSNDTSHSMSGDTLGSNEIPCKDTQISKEILEEWEPSSQNLCAALQEEAAQ